jgi:outer membrane murein-binding lipoprotein Lpp
VSARRALGAVVLAGSLALGVSACSGGERDTSGATTNLDDVGPDIARLQREVTQLREEVRALREELAAATVVTPQPPIDPTTGLPYTTTSTRPLR